MTVQASDFMACSRLEYNHPSAGAGYIIDRIALISSSHVLIADADGVSHTVP